MGGLPRRLTKINEIRTSDSNPLIVDAGDFFFSTKKINIGNKQSEQLSKTLKVAAITNSNQKWCHSQVDVKFAPKTRILLCDCDMVGDQPLLFSITILSLLRLRGRNHMFSRGSAGADITGIT